MTDTINTQETRKVDLPDTWGGELKALLWLGIPMGLTQLAGFAIYTIDLLMIGRLGPEDLAAASIGTVIYFTLWMLGFGPVMAVSPLVSQALGANQDDVYDVRISVRMALWTIALMTPILMILIVMAEPIILVFGQDPVLADKAGQYVLALAAGYPFALGVMVLRNFLAAIGKTRIPLALAIATTAINAGLNALLIFGLWGFPRLELIGAGIASSISYFLCFVMFMAYIKLDRKAARFEIFKNFFRPHWYRLREVVLLGLPISVTTMFEGMLFNACVFLMGLIGVMEVAAYQIALNVAALAFMLPFGLSMAGSVRVGLAAGAQNPDAVKRAGIVTIVGSIACIMIFAIPIALSPDFIASLYLDINDPKNTEVIRLVALFLPIAAAFMLFDAVQVSSNQLLRGLKDVNWAMMITGISFWAVGFPVAAWLGLYTEVGAKGIWYGLLSGLFVASVLLGTRFWWLAWRRVK